MSEGGTWVISWKVTAWVSWLLSAALAIGIVVVASIKEADVLSLVALSLAILAFLIQILVFIVQTFSSNQQLLQAESLNAATGRALASIEEKSEGTRVAVARLDERLLAAALGRVEQNAQEKGLSFDRTFLTQAFEEALDDVHRESDPSVELAQQSDVYTNRPWELKRRYTLKRANPNQVNEILTVLDSLAVPDLAAVYDLGVDLRAYGRSREEPEGVTHGLALGTPALQDAGLVEPVDAPWNEGSFSLYGLTALGERAAESLIESWIPRNNGQRFKLRALRTRVQEYRRARERAIDSRFGEDEA